MSPSRKCIAWSPKRNRRCKQIGAVEVVGGDLVCEYSHAVMLRDGEEVLHAETKKPLKLIVSTADGLTWSGVPDNIAPLATGHIPPSPTPSPAPAAVAAAVEAPPVEFLELPQHEGPDSENIGAPAAIGIDLGALERKAQSAWGRAPEDPVRAEAEGAREQELHQLGLGATLAWSPQRCAWWLSLLNPMLKKQGKDELTKSELEQGGYVLSPVMQDIMGAWAVGKYGALAMWCAITFGPRYAPEIAGWIRSRLRARAGQSDRSTADTGPSKRPEPQPDHEMYEL